MEYGPVERGIGCASVIPAAMIGLVGLVDDDAGASTVWLAFAEIIGWVVVCVAAHLGVAALLGQWRLGGRRRYAALAAAVAAVGAFTGAVYWVRLYAPGGAKLVYTTSLQIVGSLGPVGLILWFAFLFRDARRPS
jgi:hypothetical protein